MMNKIEKYFQKDGSQWINDAYSKHHTIAHNRFETVSEIVHQLKPDSLLDIGCGDGRFLESLSWIKNRIGADYSDSMLTLAATNPGDIRFEAIDLNSADSMMKFKELGELDVITMMGVIHYLVSPLECLQGLINCTHNKTTIVISFRNKLYNTNPKSKYYSSILTKANSERLDGEKTIWRRNGLDSEDLLMALKGHPQSKELIGSIINDGSYEGATDPEWNPESFEYWRQFTPLEAIILLGQAGFRAIRIIPLISSGTTAMKNKEGPNSRNLIGFCTSYVIVAKVMN